jgi:thiosulfate/3-mercaptopyruvate sulfurtransferase
MDLILVEPDWLQPRLEEPGVAVIDCSWFAPEAEKSGFDVFLEGHIPSACHFDLKAASDSASPYANMLPLPNRFAEVVGSLGIGNDTTVIVYDATYVSARVWWMFRLFGHEKVAILNGGWRRWKAEGRPVEVGPPGVVSPVTFTARSTLGEVADWREVLKALHSGSAQVVDARVRERFTGEQPSGYPGVPPGHMPGAVNLPWTRMMRQSGDFGFEPPETAEAIFREAGIDPDKPIVTTCGSGVTAAVLAFQLVRMGKPGWKIYDGSWNEWGLRDDLPKESA